MTTPRCSSDGNTVAEAIGLGMRVTAVCIPCNHHRDLDLGAIRARFGPDMRVRQVARRLRCSQCERLGCDVLVRPRLRAGEAV